MIYAIIVNNTVMNTVISDDAKFENWIDITNEEPMPTKGWNFSSGSFSPNSGESLTTLVVTNITNINDPQNPVNVHFTNGLVSAEEGDTQTWQAQFELNGQVVTNITQSFVLPVAGLMGSSPRVISVDVVAGLIEFDITWPNAGIWQVTEEEVNFDLPTKAFEFNPLRIKVKEPTA